MKTLEDAVALCEKEQDNFYVTAFMIEAWLGELKLRTVAEYAEKKLGKDRRLQTGEATRLYRETFRTVSDSDFFHLYGSILRFAQYDDVQSEILMRAFTALSFEEPPLEMPLSTPTRHEISVAIYRAHRMVDRLCEWLDCIVHGYTHEHYYLSPVSFDPDPEKRELAVLGVNQRCWAHLSGFGKKWWEWHHGEAAERFKSSPKWPTVGKAMADEKTRRHAHPGLDEVIICFWPLVQRHQWSYRDLLNVLLLVRPGPNDFIFDREHDLAAHCNNVLGLRKTGEGKTAANGKPEGYQVALRLCGRSIA